MKCVDCSVEECKCRGCHTHGCDAESLCLTLFYDDVIYERSIKDFQYFVEKVMDIASKSIREYTLPDKCPECESTDHVAEFKARCPKCDKERCMSVATLSSYVCITCDWYSGDKP